jgi:hypothetical protein
LKRLDAQQGLDSPTETMFIALVRYNPIDTAHRITTYMERNLTFLALPFTGLTDNIFSLGVF